MKTESMLRITNDLYEALLHVQQPQNLLVTTVVNKNQFLYSLVNVSSSLTIALPATTSIHTHIQLYDLIAHGSSITISLNSKLPVVVHIVTFLVITPLSSCQSRSSYSVSGKNEERPRRMKTLTALPTVRSYTRC